MNSDDALREFVTTRGRSLMRSAYLLTGDDHLAEDLLQATLIKVAGRWWRLRALGPELADLLSDTEVVPATAQTTSQATGGTR